MTTCFQLQVVTSPLQVAPVRLGNHLYGHQKPPRFHFGQPLTLELLEARTDLTLNLP